MASTSPEDEDRFIERIYSHVEGPGGLGALLADFAREFHAGTAHLFLIEDGGKVADVNIHDIDSSLIQPYHDRYQATDPRFILSEQQPGRVFVDTDVVDSALFERSDLYHEIMVPQDARFTMFVNRPVGDGVNLAQALMRPKWLAPFGTADRQRFERLLPHLARAVRLKRMLGTLRDQVDDLQRALDVTPTPLALVDEECRLMCANKRADALLAGGHGLRVLAGRLTAVNAHEANAISAALREALRLAGAAPSRVAKEASPHTVNITRPSGAALGLVFLPLHAEHPTFQRMAPRARALVVFHDAQAVVRVSPEAVARLHGLTPTEGLLAAALAEGATVAGFARSRGSSEHTVRTHLKRILDKTGTRRQADLVRVVLSSATGAPGPKAPA